MQIRQTFSSQRPQGLQIVLYSITLCFLYYLVLLKMHSIKFPFYSKLLIIPIVVLTFYFSSVQIYQYYYFLECTMQVQNLTNKENCTKHISISINLDFIFLCLLLLSHTTRRFFKFFQLHFNFRLIFCLKKNRIVLYSYLFYCTKIKLCL